MRFNQAKMNRQYLPCGTMMHEIMKNRPEITRTDNYSLQRALLLYLSFRKIVRPSPPIRL